MAYPDDVDTLRKLVSDPTCRVGRQRRNNRALRREDFNRRISDVCAGACGLYDRHEAPCVRRTNKFHQGERCAHDRRGPCQRTDDCLKA